MTSSDPRRLIWRTPDLPIYLILIGCLFLGVLNITHYGESYDESWHAGFSRASLAAYPTGVIPTGTADKGPFSGMVSILMADGLLKWIPGWKFIDRWHFMNFLWFLLGIYFFYRLGRRLVQPWPAAAATLLFASQPVIWGHGFINPKDLAFTGVFIGSIVLGLELGDRLSPQKENNGFLPSQDRLFQFNWKKSFQNIWAALNLAKSEWGLAQVWSRVFLIVLALLLAGVSYNFYKIQATLPAEGDSRPISMLPFWLTLFCGVAVIIALIFAIRKVFPGTRTKKDGADLTVPVLLAGSFAGFASDIRTIGPAAWVLISLYLLNKGGRKAIPAFLEYTGITALVTYLFWPKVWRDPVHTYLHMVRESVNYGWNSTTLFDGRLYLAKELPRRYLPTLFTLQLTEPALLLIAIGFVVAGLILLTRNKLSLEILIIAAWFLVPVGGAILFRSSLYDNARQFLFVWPPLFIFSGLAFQSFWGLFRRRFLFVLLSLALLAPGIYWIIQLHPYEYIYYNSLIGGVQGAFRKYELDYWAVSYKEDVEFLNTVATPNARIYLYGPNGIARTYRRSDLRTLLNPSESSVPNYAVLLGRRDAFLFEYPDSEVIYQVKRDGAILSVVKQVRTGETVERYPPATP
ncbi:MAG TPA: hypothetical protein VMT46_04365 [Anaerolineaceae bacterium]|nr:hypothetical protein [Anaerolineaceae bacterium]